MHAQREAFADISTPKHVTEPTLHTEMRHHWFQSKQSTLDEVQTNNETLINKIFKANTKQLTQRCGFCIYDVLKCSHNIASETYNRSEQAL